MVGRRLELLPTAWLPALAQARDVFLRLVSLLPGASDTDDERGSWAAALAEAPQAVPRLPGPPEPSLPRLAAAALAVHAMILLAFFWPWRHAPSPQREIAVELVQLPRTKPAPKPAPQQQQRQPHKPSAKAMRRALPPKAPAQAAQHEADKPGPMPAHVLPGVAQDGDDAVAYPQLVLSKLAKAKKEGRYMGVPGYAAVAFRISDDGSVATVRLVRPSGDPSLDTEAVAMVKRGAPYPPPPPGGRRDYAITLMFSPVR